MLTILNPILVLLIEIYMLPFVVIILNLLLLPVELVIKKKYIKKSTKKLQNINPLIIGITGSFGKTTVKHFIKHLIEDEFLVTASPKSYNTPMGLTKSILKDLNQYTEIYIAELGATSKGDILELVSFVPVDFGIITTIGNQHLESFKTIENILNTKLEILRSKNIKKLFINADNEYLKNYKYPKDIELITVGINSCDVDYLASSIKLEFNFIEFDIIHQKEKYHVKTKLLGAHNILNILISFAVGHELGILPDVLISKIESLVPVSNRLELKEMGNHLIIDDAFNSNYEGFKNALAVLNIAKDKKVLITPGLVELSEKSEEYHKELAIYIAATVDSVYLIDNPNIKYMKDVFEKIGFSSYYIYQSFREAFNNACNEKQKSTILIENDLTDYYLNGGM